LGGATVRLQQHLRLSGLDGPQGSPKPLARLRHLTYLRVAYSGFDRGGPQVNKLPPLPRLRYLSFRPEAGPFPPALSAMTALTSLVGGWVRG